MIGLLNTFLVLFLILPIILGILSVDINGNEFSLKEYVDGLEDSDNYGTDVIERHTGLKEIENGSPEGIVINNEDFDTLIGDLAIAITAFVHFSGKFGIYLGQATAPLHYLLAVVMVFSFVFPILWMYIVASIFVVITERKEIKIVFRKGIKDAELRKYFGLLNQDMRDSFHKKTAKLRFRNR